MPSLNSLKTYVPESFYHIYNRGVDKRPIFRDEHDYRFFIKLLRKYLDSNYQPKANEIIRPSFSKSIELIAYCLMPNHFHLLIYLKTNTEDAEKLFRGIMTAYVMYFNHKYKRIGPLFQGRYKASPVDQDSYLIHISRYIHLNPLDIDNDYKQYPYSSYSFYTENSKQTFISSARLKSFVDFENYKEFVEEYEELFKNRPKNSDLTFSGLS